MSEAHTHAARDGAFDWFRALDVMVWVSIVLIGALAAEWFLGRLWREKIARQASQYLAQVGVASPPATD